MSGTSARLSFPVAVVRILVFLVLVPILPLLVSGIWGWWEAWVNAGVTVLGIVASRLLAARRHPDLLAERASSMKARGVKSWDKVLAPLVALGPVAILLVAGLQQRGWEEPPAFPLAAKLTALGGILAGYSLGAWALTENRFFSGTVRLQTERGHHVVSTGPYRLVRHPGYSGGALVYLFTPILLDSTWGLIPAAAACALLVVRTALEDRTLQRELPGYAGYARHTRYRLVPGLW